MGDICLWEGAEKSVEVAHSVPRQVGGSREVGPDLFVGHAEIFPHFLPNGLLTGNGQGHVDAVQRHPIDETFPIVPLPPKHGIAKSTVV